MVMIWEVDQLAVLFLSSALMCMLLRYAVECLTSPSGHKLLFQYVCTWNSCIPNWSSFSGEIAHFFVLLKTDSFLDCSCFR